MEPYLIDNYVSVVIGISRTYHKLLLYQESKDMTDIIENKAKELNASPHLMCQIYEHKCNNLATFGNN